MTSVQSPRSRNDGSHHNVGSLTAISRQSEQTCVTYRLYLHPDKHSSQSFIQQKLGATVNAEITFIQPSGGAGYWSRASYSFSSKPQSSMLELPTTPACGSRSTSHRKHRANNSAGSLLMATRVFLWVFMAQVANSIAVISTSRASRVLVTVVESSCWKDTESRC